MHNKSNSEMNKNAEPGGKENYKKKTNFGYVEVIIW